MTTGESRLLARLGIVALLVAVAGGLWWWRHARPDPGPATATVTQASRGSAATAVVKPADAVMPAALAITVSDDRGPLAGATVRLVADAGELVIVATGGDGVARADHLEPGRWTVSASAADHLPAALPARRLVAGSTDRLALRLLSGGRTLRGTVSDATGGPIAGARIDAARLERGAAPSTAVSTTLTGADGKYQLTVVEGHLMVAAASADYAPQARPVEVGPAGAVADFALVPGGAIEGVVRDERSKEPVAGARVIARRDSPQLMLAEAATRHATSGPDGRFRLTGLRPGAWELGATDHARSARTPTIVGLGVAEQVGDVEILIGLGPVIRGRVVDSAGSPAPNTLVQAFGPGRGGDHTADATGAFELDGLAPGDYWLAASSESYIPAGRTPISLADHDVTGVVVTVARGSLLKGHVEPRQACEVQQEPALGGGAMEPTIRAANTASGPDGEFSIGPLGDGEVKLTARCASGDQGTARAQVSPGVADVVVPVTPGASIAGRVVDHDGKPVAGVDVMASEVSDGERTTIVNGMVTSGVHAMTEASGAFRVAGLSPGSYQLGVLERGRPLPARGPRTITLAAAEHKTGVELAVDRPTGVISGTVTGPDGKALADAWVSVHQDMMSTLDALRGGPERAGESTMRTVRVEVDDRDGTGGAPDSGFPPALTDAQGHYAIRGLPHASYAVTAEAQRGELRARAADIKPDATVDLQVLGVASLSGTVRGPGGPAALFSVELSGPSRAQRSFTGGQFTFGRVDPGQYVVHVRSTEGNGDARLEVKPGQPTKVDIALAANAVVVGKLVDAAGKPLAGQAVTLVPDSGDGHLQVQLDGPPPTSGLDGSFRLEHRAGPAILVVMRPPRPFVKRGLALEAGKILDLKSVVVDAPGGPGTPGGGSGAPPPP